MESKPEKELLSGSDSSAVYAQAQPTVYRSFVGSSLL